MRPFLPEPPVTFTFLPLWRPELSDAKSYSSANSTLNSAARSHLSLGFPEKHLISAPEGFFEGRCRVCEQLWPVGSIGVHVDRGIPCSVHSSMTVKHSEVGAVHRVLVGHSGSRALAGCSHGEGVLQAVARAALWLQSSPTLYYVGNLIPTVCKEIFGR